MARKVTIKNSNRWPLVLNTEPEPPPPPKKLVIQSPAERQKEKKTNISIDEEGHFVVDDFVLKVEKRNALNVDASNTQALRLNSSELEEGITQIPLDPSMVQPHPAPAEVEQKTFKFHCYRCGQKLKVPVAWANMSIPCRRCGHEIVIPPPLL